VVIEEWLQRVRDGDWLERILNEFGGDEPASNDVY
jgi:hypothetical protein